MPVSALQAQSCFKSSLFRNIQSACPKQKHFQKILIIVTNVHCMFMAAAQGVHVYPDVAALRSSGKRASQPDAVE